MRLKAGSCRWQAVLFDLDGTLLDTAPDFVTATRLLLERKGKPLLDEAVIRNAVTHGSRGIIEKVFQLAPNDENIEPLRLELVDIYFDHLHRLTRPFPGIPDILNQLQQQGIPWGIVTNKPSRYTDAIIERLPFAYPPAAVVCPDHVTDTKPHPEAIYLACEWLNINPENAIYVGDHLRDIHAGKAAGSATVAAAYGYIDKDEDPTSWQADYLIHSAAELADILFK